MPSRCLRTFFVVLVFSVSTLGGLLSSPSASAEPRTHFLVLLSDEPSACLRQLPVEKAASERLHFLSPDLRDAYTLSMRPTALALEATRQRSMEAWEVGEFLTALQRSAPALPVMHRLPRWNDTPTLTTLSQLRLTLLELEGRFDALAVESRLALSRHSAEQLCQQSAFPEACQQLRAHEQELQWVWPALDTDDLTTLRAFANARDAVLIQLRQAPRTSGIELVLLNEGRGPLLDSQLCADGDTMAQALDRWELLQHTHETRDLAKTARTARRVHYAAIGTTTAFVAASLLSGGLHAHHRRSLERCREQRSLCASQDDVISLHERRNRSKRLTIAFAIGSALSASTIYPARRWDRSSRPQDSSLRRTLNDPIDGLSETPITIPAHEDARLGIEDRPAPEQAFAETLPL